jgi:M6 family metalloprotease-like protein
MSAFRSGVLKLVLCAAIIIGFGAVTQTHAHEPESDSFGRPPVSQAYRPFGLLPQVTAWGAPWKVLVLMVDFSDAPAISSAAYFEDLFFGRHEGFHDGKPYPYETMADLYARMSGELLTFHDQTMIGWMRAPQPYTYYTSYAIVNALETNTGCYGLGAGGKGAQGGAWELLRWALDQTVGPSPKVNILDYDNDGDGFPESIFLVHAGLGAEQTSSLNESRCVPAEGRGGDIWSHQHWNTYQDTDVLYIVGPQQSNQSESGLASMGVWAHEFGHILGLPDLYARKQFSSPPGPEGYGVGCWDLMAYGIESCVRPYAGDDPGQNPREMGVWSRAAVGWNAPQPVTANVCNRLVDPIVHGGETFKVTPNADEPDDYFLVEYRARAGLDKDLPADRVCIWHVDHDRMQKFTRLPNQTACIRDGGDPAVCANVHYGLSIVQPDGEYSLERGRAYFDAGDCLGPEAEISSEFSLDLYPWSGTLPRHWKVRTGALGPQARVSIIVNMDESEVAPPVFASKPGEAVRGRVWRYQPKIARDAGVPHWRLTRAPNTMLIDVNTGLITWRVPADYGQDGVFVGVQVENCGGLADQFFELAVLDMVEPGCGCGTAPGAGEGILLTLVAMFAVLRRGRRAVVGRRTADGGEDT